MASSSYYYSLYTQYKAEVSNLQKNIEALTKIVNGISSDYYDEQSNVNRELNDLKEDLQKAVRHDNTWNTIASKCESYKEKSSSADSNLNSASSYLNEEIRSLNSKKSTAESNRDQAYRDYESAKDAEYQAWLDSLKKLITQEG